MIHHSIKGRWLFTWVHFCAVLVQFCKFWHGGASASETIQLGAHFSLTYNWGRAQIYGAPICINVMRLGAFQLLEYQMVSNQRVCRFYIKLGVSTAQQLLSSLSCNTCGNCNVRGYMGYMEVPWWNGACAGLWCFKIDFPAWQVCRQIVFGGLSKVSSPEKSFFPPRFKLLCSIKFLWQQE